MTIHLHTLKGCAPAPLANYLKALGILRLIGTQSDKQARGWWDGEYFCLLTKLSKDELETFFLDKYEPTPLLSPWNKGCGFFKSNDPGLCPIEESTAPRFKRFREGIIAARQLLDEIGQSDAAIRAIKARTKTTVKGFQTEEQRGLLEKNEIYLSELQQLEMQLKKTDIALEKITEVKNAIATITSLTQKAAKPPSKAEAESLKASTGYKRLLAAADRRFQSLKATLIPDCRRLWRGSHAEWMSAAIVLDEEGNPIWPSLFGTGGNDGNLDFTNNYMLQLVILFETSSETPVRRSLQNELLKRSLQNELLKNAIWSAPANKLVRASIGQYQPGSAGGANSSTGFASGNLVNPWDFVLMMEGSLLFSSRATKRLDPNALSRASAPFAVRSHATGFATPGFEKAQRGEQWMPLWKQPATLPDVTAMFTEARIQVDRQTANRPIDVARAISRLGVARGIDSFVRYGYFERNGQLNLAVPLGRVQVQQRPLTYLIDDFKGWLDRLQRQSRDKNAPARLSHAERRLANAVFAALTHDHTPARWQAILLAAAEIESLQATGTAIEAGPIPPLRPEWFAAIDDNSAEVRLALALGSSAADYIKGRPIDSVRHHWIPLESGGRRFRKADNRLINDPRVVASGRDTIRDLAAVVERRLIESRMKGERRSRLMAAPGCGARLGDLEQFLSGSLDHNKLLGLARAFMAIKWDRWRREHGPQTTPSKDVPEESWLAIRLANLPWELFPDKDIPADPRIVRLLMSANASLAIQVAGARLRSVGIRPPFQAGGTTSDSARLWAAAIAFPIHRSTARRGAVILDPRLKGLPHVRS